MKLAAVILAFVGSMAFADDTVNSQKDTVDTSKNPITGTKKTVKKHKEKIKDAHGNEHEATITKTTKEYKDGEIKKETEIDTETTKK